jgi:hypothetical protein
MRNILFIGIGILVGYMAITITSTVMYTNELASFYNIKWKFNQHGISLNGHGSYGNLVSILELEATKPKNGSGSVAQWCPNITSDRGHNTLSTVDDALICCWTHEEQKLVLFKDDKNTRSYFCGKWPNIDIVHKPLPTLESIKSQEKE